MKAKALLLTAALVAAGASTSMAQVFSVNAVGYVNRVLTPGFNLVANPLNAADNSAGSLFKNFQGGVPEGTRVFVFKNGQYVTLLWEALDEAYLPTDEAATLIPPGTGAFVFVGGNASKTLTFVGEVKQGSLSTPVPQGFSIKASEVPMAGRPDQNGLPGAAGDRFFRYNTTTGAYNSWLFEELDNAWLPTSGVGAAGLPSIDVGEAFFFFRSGAATAWTRTFNVNAS
jgi:hypothetical protein